MALHGLKELLPLKIYATFETYAAEAAVVDFVTLAGDVFKVGVVIEWNGQTFKNPCKAGLSMTQALRQHMHMEDTKCTTFDGWHRLKVIVNNTVYRLDEIMTSDIRRGLYTFEHMPLPELDVPTQRSLFDIIRRNNVINNASASSAHYAAMGSTPSMDNYGAVSAAHLTHIPLIIRPFLTVLMDYFKKGPADIMSLMPQLPKSVLMMVTDTTERQVDELLAALTK